jgi:hypothetical protein
MAVQLTVRGVDPGLERQLRDEARRRGLSLNQTTLLLLRQALGMSVAAPPNGGDATSFNDLDHLAGTWSAADAEEFSRALRDTRRVDQELWP